MVSHNNLCDRFGDEGSVREKMGELLLIYIGVAGSSAHT